MRKIVKVFGIYLLFEAAQLFFKMMNSANCYQSKGLAINFFITAGCAGYILSIAFLKKKNK